MKLRTLTTSLAVLAGLAVAPDIVAQSGADSMAITSPVANRAHHWEFYVIAQYWTAEDGTVKDVTLPTLPPTVTPGAPTATSDLNFKFDDSFMWGLGFAYNYSNKLATRFEFTFGEPDYEMGWNGGKLTGEAFIHTGKVNIEYNFFDRPLTPFVGAGIGYLYIDTGIPSGPPEFWYWWDYYWGPVVVATQPTFDAWCFTYNATIGLRWDLSDTSVVRLAVAGNWVDMDSASGTAQTIETS